MNNLNMDGCIRLIGSVVRCSIADAKFKITKRSSSYQIQMHKEANEFLFKAGRLEQFFLLFHLEHVVNCNYIRKQAEEIIKNDFDISRLEITERMDEEDEDSIC